MRFRWACAVAALAISLAACAGGSDDEDGSVPAANGPASATGPGISIQQALASDLEGPLLVNGWLWRRDGGDVRLCTALAESFPPQCAEPSLRVKDLDLNTVSGLRTEGDVTWSEAPVQILGEVKNGVLTVASRSRG